MYNKMTKYDEISLRNSLGTEQPEYLLPKIFLLLNLLLF